MVARRSLRRSTRPRGPRQNSSATAVTGPLPRGGLGREAALDYLRMLICKKLNAGIRPVLTIGAVAFGDGERSSGGPLLPAIAPASSAVDPAAGKARWTSTRRGGAVLDRKFCLWKAPGRTWRHFCAGVPMPYDVACSCRHAIIGHDPFIRTDARDRSLDGRRMHGTGVCAHPSLCRRRPRRS